MINHKAMKEKHLASQYERAKQQDRYIYEILVQAGILIPDIDGKISIHEGRYMGHYSVAKVQ